MGVSAHKRWSWGRNRIQVSHDMVLTSRSDCECMLPREKMVGNKRAKVISMQVVVEKGSKPLIKVMYWTSSSWLK
jgi:hypothetical protein